MFKINLNVLDKEYKSTGKTIDEAISNIGLNWIDIKGKSILIITRGKESYKHLFNIKTMRRILSNKIVRAYWDKNLTMLLKSDKDTNISK